jgi:small-conductance mechanosensitive channel
MGISSPLSAVIARAVRIIGTVVVVVAAISLLGFETLTASLNAVILFLPRALAAAALLVAGVVLAEWLRHHVDRGSERMDLAAPLGALVEVTVIGIFAITALAQLAVPLAILTVIVMILVAATAFGLALAFGLGSRELAREITAGRSLAGSLEVGQTIETGQIRGEIVGFESAATILQGPGDQRLRVPNRLLADAVLILHQAPPVVDEGGSTAR